MRPQGRSERRAAYLLLLMLILGMQLGGALLPAPGPDPLPCPEKVYVQLGGDVSRPGVHAFCSRPSLEDLMEAAEGRRVDRGKDIAGGEPVFAAGERVSLLGEAGREGFTRGDMPGFYRMTLGIPLSLNRESAAGLSALPGIGPGLAGLIVEERSRRGGFRSLEELTTVRGIGPRLFEKMKPHLVL